MKAELRFQYFSPVFFKYSWVMNRKFNTKRSCHRGQLTASFVVCYDPKISKLSVNINHSKSQNFPRCNEKNESTASFANQVLRLQLYIRGSKHLTLLPSQHPVRKKHWKVSISQNIKTTRDYRRQWGTFGWDDYKKITKQWHMQLY